MATGWVSWNSAPAAPPVPEIEIIALRIRSLERKLAGLEQHREYYLSMCHSLIQQQQVAAEIDAAIEEMRTELARLQAKWAHIAEKLEDPPEAAAARDETARRLLEGLDL
ncbi:MAG TPA: hypothetical protein VF914_11250 [Chloroflexia bacterium]|jgi:uncharacterized coiled-coil protein SlyX